MTYEAHWRRYRSLRLFFWLLFSIGLLTAGAIAHIVRIVVLECFLFHSSFSIQHSYSDS